ncbi:unnamed protein product [Alternaria burnsii]|nr:unnamed protein product [Alternaria burnsii]
MEDQNAYEYSPIDAKAQIRVLRLEPGTFAEPLIGSLLVRKIGDNEDDWPEYDGVSYCWGPQDNLTSFTCDGKALRITAVVDDMLRHLRESNEQRHLWIDALCINQADTLEKSQQVRSMARIYAFASKVRVWLGPATDEELDAIHPMFDSSDLDEDTLWGIIQKKYSQPASDIAMSALPSIRKFFSRAWFTRRWVLQEVAVSWEAVVHCGTDEISWYQFHERADSLWWAYKLAHGADATTRTLNNIIMLKTFGKDPLNSRGKTSSDKSVAYVSILDLMQTYHTSVCVDERDRLYALYGLLPGAITQDDGCPGLVLPCPVDYNLHFSETYFNLASASIKAGLSHKIFVHAIEFGNLAQQEETWSSWVPSWNKTRKLTNVGNLLRYLRPFQSSSHKKSWSCCPRTIQKLWREENPNITDVGESKALHLSGFLHQIIHTQSSTGKSGAISYFTRILESQEDRRISDIYRSSMAWVIALAVQCIPTMCSRPALDLQSILTRGGQTRISDLGFEEEIFLWIAAEHVFGLQSYDREIYYAGIKVPKDINVPELLSEISGLLEGYDAFTYEHDRSFKFGIAFGQAEPGDFVFRTPGAVRGQDARDSKILPSAFGLIIRPYKSESDASPTTFRLVGMCIDWHPDVKDPEFVEVVLV